MAFESKLTVMTSALPTGEAANRRNEEISNLLLSLYGESDGDLVIGAEVIEYDEAAIEDD